MRIGIIIPVHNEALHLRNCIQSLLLQSYEASQIILVDDHSTDETPQIIKALKENENRIISVRREAGSAHLPGSKVVAAFNAGLLLLKNEIDVICKYDADLIFPANYLESIVEAFQQNPKLGVCGGQCAINIDGQWVPEIVADPDHVRGALKAYRKECFRAIGGLREAMGWDTLDELLATYHGWQVAAFAGLEVKHMRPTGHTYTSAARRLKGKALYSMGYGLVLSALAAAKMAKKEGKILRMLDHMSGYFRAAFSGEKPLVTRDEGRYIRKLRWSRMFQKLKK